MIRIGGRASPCWRQQTHRSVGVVFESRDHRSQRETSRRAIGQRGRVVDRIVLREHANSEARATLAEAPGYGMVVAEQEVVDVAEVPYVLVLSLIHISEPTRQAEI